MTYKYELKIRKDKELEEYTCKIESAQPDAATLLDHMSNLVEARVSPTEPTQPQQVFTIEEVKELLKQQRANCANTFMSYDDYAYIKQCTKETISTLKRVEILNASEPKIIRAI